MNHIAYTRITLVGIKDPKNAHILRSHEEQYSVLSDHVKADLEQYAESEDNSSLNKPELQQLLADIREGDIIYIYDFSRIAYSIKELLRILKAIQKKGAFLFSLKEDFNSGTSKGEAFIGNMKQLYSFEAASFRERQAIGIEKAVTAKKYGGRKACPPLTKKDYNRLRRNKISKAGLARELHISRPTLYKLIEDYNTIEFMPPCIGLVFTEDDWVDDE